MSAAVDPTLQPLPDTGRTARLPLEARLTTWPLAENRVRRLAPELRTLHLQESIAA